MMQEKMQDLIIEQIENDDLENAEHSIKEYRSLEINYIWNLVGNYMMIFMRAVFCQALHLILNYKC